MNYTMNNTTDNTPKMGMVPFEGAGDYAPALAPNQGNAQALEIFVKRYEPKLMAIALVFTRVREDAENIVQETLRKAFRHVRQFECESSFLTWLTRVAVKEAFMLLRRRGKELQVGYQVAVVGADDQASIRSVKVGEKVGTL